MKLLNQEKVFHLGSWPMASSVDLFLEGLCSLGCHCSGVSAGLGAL